MGLLGLQCLPFMASLQIICCCSRVAEKIQETLPHRKEVNRMNHGIDQAEILICSYRSCRKRESWNSISNTSILLFNSLIIFMNIYFMTHISRPSTLSFTFTVITMHFVHTINIIIVETFSFINLRLYSWYYHGRMYFVCLFVFSLCVYSCHLCSFFGVMVFVDVNTLNTHSLL